MAYIFTTPIKPANPNLTHLLATPAHVLDPCHTNADLNTSVPNTPASPPLPPRT